MKIVFVSNYINHHQIPLCDKLMSLCNGEFTFVQTEPIEEERLKMGWDKDAVLKPYVRLYYEEKDALDALILSCDCVIFGGCEDESVIRPRLLQNKLTIRYSERIYRDGRWKFISPRGLRKKYYDHTMFRKNDAFLLCAGSYVKGDFRLIHAYPNKMLKFGYFPKTEVYEDINQIRNDNARTEILWVSRFIELKHPELVVELAKRLKKNGVNAHVTMLGSGELREQTEEACKKNNLLDFISFEGNRKPEEVREKMRGADVFLFTSDHREGWGAVVNEAMNAGCVAISSDKVGASHYLIKPGETGYIFKSQSVDDLYDKVMKVVNNKGEARRIGAKAYNSIVNLWNAEVAAKRLFDFVSDENHRIPDYEDGPLSKA